MIQTLTMMGRRALATIRSFPSARAQAVTTCFAGVPEPLVATPTPVAVTSVVAARRAERRSVGCTIPEYRAAPGSGKAPR